MNRLWSAFTLAALLAFALTPDLAAAAGPRAFRAVFVGTDAQCGGPGTAGSQIVTSMWLTGIGLPDNVAVGNDSTTTAAKRDVRWGLLLSKNGTTPNCAAAGADIGGTFDHTITADSTFGFDYRNGTHCGAGAPRFNVYTTLGALHFGGCAAGLHVPAPQDADQWTRVRLGLGDFFPPLAAGDTIESVEIVFDEGTDTANNDTEGVGLSIIDNILINGKPTAPLIVKQ
jgi:hypothetical protein